MKFLPQLTDYVIGRESRLGAPTRYLSDDSPAELSDPIFATAIGLVMFGLHHEAELAEEEALRQQEREVRMAEVEAARREAAEAQAAAEAEAAEKAAEKEEKPKRKLFDWTQTTKEMLVKWVKDVDEDDEVN